MIGKQESGTNKKLEEKKNHMTLEMQNGNQEQNLNSVNDSNIDFQIHEISSFQRKALDEVNDFDEGLDELILQQKLQSRENLVRHVQMQDYQMDRQ